MFSRFITIILLVLIGVCLAKTNPNRNRDDEPKDNSIGLIARTARQYMSSFLPQDWDKSSLVTGIAMPALFLLFLSSVTGGFGSKDSPIDTNMIRKKRSPITNWANNLQNMFNNFQKAIEKMKKFEEELENEINDEDIETFDTN